MSHGAEHLPAIPNRKDVPDPVQSYGLIVEGAYASPLFGTRAAAEGVRDPRDPERPLFGALPYLKSPAETAELFHEEAAYFAKHYTPGKPGVPKARDLAYAQAIILFEAKFGKRLSAFAEEILAHYPPLGGQPKGYELHLFGLSGAGKSTAIEAAKELLGPHTIVMDNDTVRFNLFGKMVKDIELAHGANLFEVRHHLIHNTLSSTLYFLLHYVSQELKERGYNVVRSSTMPEDTGDLIVYLSHPDGIDPLQVTDETLPAVAKQLAERTQARIPEKDDYDWEHGKTITDFRDMPPVTVQVPERIHVIFLKNIHNILTTKPGIRTITNQRLDDPALRKQFYRSQLAPMIQRMEEERRG